MERHLTKRFTQFTIFKLEKETGLKMEELISIDKLSAGDLLRLVKAGNNHCSYEEASEIADAFIEKHGFIEYTKQLLKELYTDLGMYKKGMFEDDKTDIDTVIKEKETVIKNNESVKVDVNGFVSLD